MTMAPTTLAAEAVAEKLRAERDAQRRDLEKTIRNQRAELRRLQALERVHWQSVERWRGTREGLEGKVKAAEAERDALRAERDRYLRHLTAGAESLNAYKARAEAAEAQNAALTARVEGLTGALRDIEADCDADYPPSHGAIKQAARAALSTTEADNEPT